MKFKPNPLLYGASEDFFSSFKLAVIMSDTVDSGALSRAVTAEAMSIPLWSSFAL